MAKYKVKTREYVSAYIGHATEVRVERRRRILPNKWIGEAEVQGKREQEAPKNASNVDGWRIPSYPYEHETRKPVTEDQIREASLKVIADYEFPRPQIEWCKEVKQPECKKL